MPGLRSESDVANGQFTTTDSLIKAFQSLAASTVITIKAHCFVPGKQSRIAILYDSEAEMKIKKELN